MQCCVFSLRAPPHPISSMETTSIRVATHSTPLKRDQSLPQTSYPTTHVIPHTSEFQFIVIKSPIHSCPRPTMSSPPWSSAIEHSLLPVLEVGRWRHLQQQSAGPTESAEQHQVAAVQRIIAERRRLGNAAAHINHSQQAQQAQPSHTQQAEGTAVSYASAGSQA